MLAFAGAGRARVGRAADDNRRIGARIVPVLAGRIEPRASERRYLEAGSRRFLKVKGTRRSAARL